MSDPAGDPKRQEELFTGDEANQNRTQANPWLDGRDELNLAEFPLAALSNRIAADQKTLEFKDTIFDKESGQLIDRRLTVVASDKYGLPNAIDDEIILALIQLAKRQGFASKTVPFSRYEIIQILGWGKDTWNYHRVLESLERWTSITLKYENAWRDAASNTWVNETFHIIDRLTEIKDDGKERAAFVWNDVLFNNLRSGHLKTLDLEMYRRLKNPTAKRLYRLLDKRFWHRRRVKFNLAELTYHKLGISQNYQGSIKQRLEPAIKELEEAGFIKSADKGERYSKHGVGEWNIIFEQAQPEGNVPLVEEPDAAADASEVERAMIELGVSANKAARLATTFPEEYLLMKIEEVRFLLVKTPAKVKNPAGFLVKSIEDKFSKPMGFFTAEELAAAEQSREEKKSARVKAEAARLAREEKKRAAEHERAAEQTAKVEAYLDALSLKERQALVDDVLQRERNKGGPFGRWADEDSVIGRTHRQNCIELAVMECMKQAELS